MFVSRRARRKIFGKYVPSTSVFGLGPTPAYGGLGCACKKTLGTLGDDFDPGDNISGSMYSDPSFANSVSSNPNPYNLPGLTPGPVYPSSPSYPSYSSPSASSQIGTLAQQLALTSGVASGIAAVPQPAASTSGLSSNTILLGGGALILVAILASRRR